MNPAQLFKLKSEWAAFSQRHPKFVKYLQVAGGRLEEGALVEVNLKREDGSELRSNFRLTKEDIALLEKLMK